MTQETIAPVARSRSKGLPVPKIINIAIYSAIYFAVVAACAMISNFCIGPAGNILLPTLSAIIAGPLFMLMMVRVRKFGAITIMGFVLGLSLFLTGHFVTSLITALVFPLIGDLVAHIGNYRNKTTLLAGYMIFSLGAVGPILPMWLMKNTYIEHLGNKGLGANYIDQLFGYVSSTTLAGAMLGVIIGAFLGGLIGLRLLWRHFDGAAAAAK